MEDSDEGEQNEHSLQTAVGFLGGILVGGLVGAVTMLLAAPQSGKRTRSQIRHKSMELRDQATDTIEEGMAEARAIQRHISAGVHKQAEKIQQRSQDLIGQQKARWSPIVEAGQKAVQGNSKS
jgi:gas vesicle protein